MMDKKLELPNGIAFEDDDKDLGNEEIEKFINKYRNNVDVENYIRSSLKCVYSKIKSDGYNPNSVLLIDFKFDGSLNFDGCVSVKYHTQVDG